MLLSFPVVALSGCTDCSPPDPSATADVSFLQEEVRTLPIIASGAKGVWPFTPPPGLELPDSHGYIETRLETTAGLPWVDVDGLSVELEVAGQEIPIRLTRVEGGRSDDKEEPKGKWSDRVYDRAALKIWWAVDRSQVSSVSRMVLSEGASYSLTIDFSWRHTSCGGTVAGNVTRIFTDFIQASVNAKTFEGKGMPDIETTDDGAGFKAQYGVGSGLEADVKGGSALIVYFSGSNKGEAALITFPSVGTKVNGLPASKVTPADTLEIYSAADAVIKASYGVTGTVIPPGYKPGAGLYVTTITISYTPSQATLGATNDVFGYGVLKGEV